MHQDYIYPEMVAEMDTNALVRVSRIRIGAQQVHLNLQGQGRNAMTDDLKKKQQILMDASMQLWHSSAWGADMSVGDVMEVFEDIKGMPINSFRKPSPETTLEDLEK
ncbi:MAG: hypothetical protein FWE31_00820 [Firmicutes bacterium]|nr:hypothetical protein [Bacillota bacterium]